MKPPPGPDREIQLKPPSSEKKSPFVKVFYFLSFLAVCATLAAAVKLGIMLFTKDKSGKSPFERWTDREEEYDQRFGRELR